MKRRQQVLKPRGSLDIITRWSLCFRHSRGSIGETANRRGLVGSAGV